MNLDMHVKTYDDCYSLDNRLMLHWYPNRVVNMAKGDSFLELGLGHGYSANIFSKRFLKYKVIEGSRVLIDRFILQNPETRIEFINDFFETYETQEKFCNIGMGFILEHVDEPEYILQKYKGYLKEGGSIFIAVPNGQSLHRRIGYEAGLLKDMFALSHTDIEFGHKRIFSLDNLKKMVLSCGYRIASVEGILLKPITTNQMKELKMSEEILQGMLKVGVNYPELSNAILMELKKGEF